MDKLKIKIHSDLAQKLAKLSEDGGYSSIEEFILHILEKEVAAMEKDEPGSEAESGSQDELKNRLKGLGYIS